MNVAIDYDGVITANWQHYLQLASDLKKSGHNVYVLTAANYLRHNEIISRLVATDFQYTEIIFRPKNFLSSPKNIGKWKKEMLQQYNIKIWFDNEVKNYELEGIDFSDLALDIVRI